MKAVVLSVALLVSQIVSAEPNQAQQDLIAYLKSDQEPRIGDAVWMTDEHLYVAVKDDGSRRDGFAQYVCLKAMEKGVYPELVKVVDLVAIYRQQDFIELGLAFCPKKT